MSCNEASAGKMSVENIRVGAAVEVLRDGFICWGKVRWTGKVHGRNGDWVGVELIKKGGFQL